MFRATILGAATAILTLTPTAADAGKPKKGDKLEALFKKLDTNNDGKLSPAEFARMSGVKNTAKESSAKPGKGGKKTEALFKKLDADNDGFLSLDEFRKIKELKKKKADKLE